MVEVLRICIKALKKQYLLGNASFFLMEESNCVKYAIRQIEFQIVLLGRGCDDYKANEAVCSDGRKKKRS